MSPKFRGEVLYGGFSREICANKMGIVPRNSMVQLNWCENHQHHCLVKEKVEHSVPKVEAKPFNIQELFSMRPPVVGVTAQVPGIGRDWYQKT